MVQHIRLTPAILLGLAILLSALPAAASPDVRAAIESANGAFAAAGGRGDAAAITSLYTKTAQLYPPQSDIVTGTQAIGQFWQAALAAGIKGVTLTTLEVEVHGTTAIETGKYALSGDGGKAIDAGKYMVIWKREGGKWKLHRDIWNSSAPPPAR